MKVSRFFPRYNKTLPLASTGVFLFVILLSSALRGPVTHTYASPAPSSGPSFSLQPVFSDPANPSSKAYFIFHSQPAAQEQNSVRVINVGTAQGSVNLYAVDATTSQTTGVAYLDHKDKQQDVGTWISLSSNKVTLDPGKSQEVPFQLKVPRGALPGQHVGGIIAETVTTDSSKPEKNKIVISLQQVIAIAVVVNLPGPSVELLTATGIQEDISSSHQRLLVALHNTGTMMVKPTGTLQVFTDKGSLVQKWKLNLDVFLPRTSIQYPANILNSALTPGKYRADLLLTYGKKTKHILAYSTTFSISKSSKATGNLGAKQTANPWQAFLSSLTLWHYIAGILVLLLAAGGLFYWKRRGRRSPPDS